MTELLPGPEDPGKHLFEISPGRPERFISVLALAPVARGRGCGVSLQLWTGKGHLYNTPLCTKASSVSKHNSEIGQNLDDIVNLGEFQKTQSSR